MIAHITYSPQYIFCDRTANIYGDTPLIEAVTMGSGEISKFLLDKGANVNQANHKSITALHKVGYLDDSGDCDIDDCAFSLK